MNFKKRSVYQESLLSRDVRQFILIVMIMFLLLKVIFILAYVPTASMEPTIHKKSALIGWRLGYLLADPIPERGTIIVFDHKEFDEHLVKRVIGVPGDEVRIIEGQVYINGTKINEPYITEKSNDDRTYEFNVPEGKLFVLGDNRNGSNDSRYWNEPFVEIHDVYANVILRLNYISVISHCFEEFSNG